MTVYAVMHEIWVDYMECGVESLFDTKEKPNYILTTKGKVEGWLMVKMNPNPYCLFKK